MRNSPWTKDNEVKCSRIGPSGPVITRLQDSWLSREESWIEVKRAGLAPDNRFVRWVAGIEQYVELLRYDH